MNHLILVRHSLPKVNPARPASQWELSAEGRARCLPLAKKIALYESSIIITSVEKKARQTGQILAQSLGLPIHSMDGLQEHERGNEPYLKSPEQFHNEIKELFEMPEQLVFGLETASQALTRYSEAVDKIVLEQALQNIVLVTHGTVMALFIAHHNRINGYQFWQTLNLPDWFVLTIPDYLLVTPTV